MNQNEKKIMEKGFDHPCRQTCSGWQQGYNRGKLDAQKNSEGLVKALEKARQYLLHKLKLGFGREEDLRVIDTAISVYKATLEEK